MNTKLTRSLIVVFLFMTLAIEEGRGETRQSLLDQSFTSPYSYNSNINGCCAYVAQTFTAGMNGTLKGVSINVISEYPHSTKLRVSINSVENGLPTMNVLVSKNLSSGNSSISEIINFPNGVSIIVGVQYAIVVSYIDPPSSIVQGYWTGDINNSYLGGECRAYNGASWNYCVQVSDVNFRTYVNTDSMYNSVHNINSNISYDGMIQAAIDEANPGDEIRVDSGTYYGYFEVTKPLILRGIDTGMGKPVVDAESTLYLDAITLSAGGIALAGFNATNASGYVGSGILVVSDNNTIIGNDVSENNFGIFVINSYDNVISANNASRNGIGITTLDSANNAIHSNNVYDNNYAISLYTSNNNRVYNNNFSENYLSINLENTDDNIFYNNLFNNTNGLVLKGVNSNRWNITKVPGTTTVEGPYLGGNFWANMNGTGFSQNCTDSDRDGICDAGYPIIGSDIDYLPITYFVPDSTIPESISNLTNITYAQTSINWTWDEPQDQDFYKVKIYLDGNFQKDVYKGENFFNATGLVPATVHIISVKSVDTSGNINETWINHTSTTRPDFEPPVITVTSPLNITYLTTSIFLNVSANEPISIWNYSLNEEQNISFTPNTIITAPQGENNIIIYAMDISGNWNSSRIIFTVDTIAPSGVIDLYNISYSRTYINWTWTDPSDPDLSMVLIYMNGVFQRNVTNGIQYYNATNLTENTLYTISTRTVDASGNMNMTWVNSSANTSPYLPMIITVDDSGGADYLKIQDAINASSDGDTIIVAPGTYIENVNVNKKVTLIGAGDDVTIVNASDPSQHVFSITINNVTVHGFTLKGAAGSQKAGIYLNQVNYCTISKNNIWQNAIGIYLDISYNNTIYNNHFNNTNNFMISGPIYGNYWNSSKTQDFNVVYGKYIGGNFWARPDGTGFGQNCTDPDRDGICNSSYSLGSGNLDYLPLAIPTPGYVNGTMLHNNTGISDVVVSINTSTAANTNSSGFYSFLVPTGKYILTAASEPVYQVNNTVIVTILSDTTIVRDI
ncbi:MAG TPA: NosD domain-containing protein [Candidatus Limnocylindrales bacterium]|nr:NosD domain-containing protein [Candidatus Limnocylindrales bacterium]